MRFGISQTPRKDQIIKFRQAHPIHQQTYKTPLEDLPRFVHTLLTSFEINNAVVTLDQVVFEPRELLSLLAQDDQPQETLWRGQIFATGRSAVETLLETTLADWIDFLILFDNPAISLYADHDEYTTLFTQEAVDLERVKAAMREAGFTTVNAWTRF